MKKYLIVGAGFSGAVLAEQLSQMQNVSVLVVDERDHIGGNCYTFQDEVTGITEHKYGPHIFNTDSKVVWDYISKFTKMVPYTNRVKAICRGEVYSIPINLHTINQFFRKTLNPENARTFIDGIRDKKIKDPCNFEELALMTVGEDLYRAFFYYYSKKQWGCEPSLLPASILKRIPVRFTYNDNYYDNKFQGIPEEGYTPVFERMLNHHRVKVQLNVKFTESFQTEEFDHVFYTGPIDSYFNYKFGRLGYRTVYFEKGYSEGDFQGNAVINYTDDSVPYTRIHEHKHFTPWKHFNETIFFKEYSRETGENDIPFYPRLLPEDLIKLELYREEAANLKRITFSGRLGNYCYMDMHNVINEALGIASKFRQDI